MKFQAVKLRVFAFLLALLLLFPLAACAGKQGKALLTLDAEGVKVTFSVNHYRFLLSRLRGNFVRQGIANSAGSADQAAFWNMQGYFDGSDTLKTWDSYYCEQVLENCKVYLFGLWIFEKNKLSLSDAARSAIEEELNDILTYQADGSKTKLNSILANYGVNYNLLKSFYETEAKVEAAMQFLYGENASLLDATVKDPYLNEHYFRYKRILFPFTEDENVTPTEDQKAQIRTQADNLLAKLQGKTEAEFETVMAEKNEGDEYTDGYYIPKDESVANSTEQASFISTISQKLSTMEVGEVALLELSDGIQILRKYEPTSGAYDLDVNAVWFESFAKNLMAELFQKEYKSMADKFAVDEAVLAEAPKIKETEANYYF